ncbi:MAG: M48 family metalloprotease [Gammaproteobacteria bacterium]|jgi:Zn-dependent protease with chaperone function|nr:M48 family metalloprotease [Gammaproteobacteria bacterium]
MPGLYLAYVCAVPVLSIALWYGISLIIASFHLRHQVGIFELSKNSKYRKLNAKNSKESKIRHSVNNLCLKLKISKPDIYIEFNESNEPLLRAFAIGWPFRHQLAISADLLKIYLNGLTHQSFEALLAHEMNHIKNADSALGAVDSILSNTFKTLFVLCLFFSPSIFSLPILVLASLGLINELASAMLIRSQELLADSGALTITQKPQAMKRFLYDLYLQYLHWGRIVIENKYACERWLMTNDPKQINQIKSLHRQLSVHNYQNLYDSFVAVDQQEHINSAVNSSLLWQAPQFIYTRLKDLKETSFTWLNTHPTVNERLKNLSMRLS